MGISERVQDIFNEVYYVPQDWWEHPQAIRMLVLPGYAPMHARFEIALDEHLRQLTGHSDLGKVQSFLEYMLPAYTMEALKAIGYTSLAVSILDILLK